MSLGAGDGSAGGTGSGDADLVARAVDGDQGALADVLRRVQDPLYRLALRMTGRVPDAEDATQEILIRVMTRLASFRGEASLVTWAYRIGVNYLINARRALPQEMLTIDVYRQDLLDGLSAPAYTAPDAELLAEEVRLLCTQALLQCLDRPARAAYIVGDILRLPGEEAAWILQVPAATYRKRLERARRQLRTAVSGRCGLLDPAAPCKCGKRINYAKALGRIGPEGPVLATHPVSPAASSGTVSSGTVSSGTVSPNTAAFADKLRTLRGVGDLLRAHPSYVAPPARTEALLALIRSGSYQGLLPDDEPT